MSQPITAAILRLNTACDWPRAANRTWAFYLNIICISVPEEDFISSCSAWRALVWQPNAKKGCWCPSERLLGHTYCTWSHFRGTAALVSWCHYQTHGCDWLVPKCSSDDWCCGKNNPNEQTTSRHEGCGQCCAEAPPLPNVLPHKVHPFSRLDPPLMIKRGGDFLIML